MRFVAVIAEATWLVSSTRVSCRDPLELNNKILVGAYKIFWPNEAGITRWGAAGVVNNHEFGCLLEFSVPFVGRFDKSNRACGFLHLVLRYQHLRGGPRGIVPGGSYVLFVHGS